MGGLDFGKEDFLSLFIKIFIWKGLGPQWNLSLVLQTIPYISIALTAGSLLMYPYVYIL